MKKEVLIISGYPPANFHSLEQGGIPLSSFLKSISEKNDLFYLPLHSLGSIAVGTYAALNDVNISIKDYYFDTFTDSKPDIIGISSTFYDLPHVSEMARFFKEKYPDTKIILGGPLSWSYPPKKILSTIQEIDVIVMKEGEQTFVDVCNTLLSNKKLGNVDGIVYKENGNIKTKPLRAPMQLDDLPFPDWRLVDLQNKINMIPIETARGCVYNCGFCSEVHYWDKPVRFKTIKRVIDEFEFNIKTFNTTTFRFVDSCFTAPEKRCMEICDNLISNFINNGINIKWSSYGRVSDLHPRLIEKMKNAGCVALDIGMESGDNAILNKMNKKYSSSNIANVISCAKGAGIITNCNIIIGFPGETMDSVNKTIDILNTLGPDIYQCVLLDLAPNTDLNENPNKYGISGDRLEWKHETMNSDSAKTLMKKMTKEVTASCLFPGGEYVACMFTALGYSQDEIRNFFRNISCEKYGDTEYDMVKRVFKQY